RVLVLGHVVYVEDRWDPELELSSAPRHDDRQPVSGVRQRQQLVISFLSHGWPPCNLAMLARDLPCLVPRPDRAAFPPHSIQVRAWRASGSSSRFSTCRRLRRSVAGCAYVGPSRLSRTAFARCPSR